MTKLLTGSDLPVFVVKAYAGPAGTALFTIWGQYTSVTVRDDQPNDRDFVWLDDHRSKWTTYLANFDIDEH